MRGFLRLLGFAAGAATVTGVLYARKRGITLSELVRLELNAVREDARLAIGDGKVAAQERRRMLDTELDELR